MVKIKVEKINANLSQYYALPMNTPLGKFFLHWYHLTAHTPIDLERPILAK